MKSLSSTMSEKEDINQLHDDFNKRFKDIQASIDVSKDPASLKTDINDIKGEIEKVSHLLPTYQQLSYSEQIRSLFDKVEKKSQPTRRFKFSRRPESKKPSSTEETRSKDTSSDTKQQEVVPFLTDVENSVHVIKDEPSLLITNISSSVVVVKNVDSVTIKSITNSIILLESNGPAFLFDITGSIVFVRSHQLRIHNTHESTLIPKIDSKNAIIENCQKLIFKPRENEEIRINDFDHPSTATPSPNYKKEIIAKKDIELRELLERGEETALHKVLNNLQTFN